MKQQTGLCLIRIHKWLTCTILAIEFMEKLIREELAARQERRLAVKQCLAHSFR